jgi:hypothetical protein
MPSSREENEQVRSVAFRHSLHKHPGVLPWAERGANRMQTLQLIDHQSPAPAKEFFNDSRIPYDFIIIKTVLPHISLAATI